MVSDLLSFLLYTFGGLALLCGFALLVLCAFQPLLPPLPEEEDR
tara:strand:- start:666 stop:797 length:132 start_codon:yes stop_codon:yes gene_type:complete